MGRPCSICNHPSQSDISRDLLSGIHYREIARRHSVTIAALSTHLKNHIAGPIRRIIQAETNLAKDCLTVEPVLMQMRRLNNHVLRVLTIAEASKDQAMVLAAVKEARENLQLVAKLTGELNVPAIAVSVNAGPPGSSAREILEARMAQIHTRLEQNIETTVIRVGDLAIAGEVLPEGED
jgi:hypothetical protein